jgi:hypothetical protein
MQHTRSADTLTIFLLLLQVAKRLVNSCLPLAATSAQLAAAMVSFCRKCVVQADSRGRLTSLHVLTALLRPDSHCVNSHSSSSSSRSMVTGSHERTQLSTPERVHDLVSTHSTTYDDDKYCCFLLLQELGLRIVAAVS